MTAYKGVTRVPSPCGGEGWVFHLNGYTSYPVYKTAEIASKARARHFRNRSPYFFADRSLTRKD